MSRINIAIDGPAGAGKSTIAKIVSRSLGIIYLDTGAMYRSVALKAIKEGIDTQDTLKLSQMVKDIDLRVIYCEGEQKIFLDGEDISCRIRTPQVSTEASNVAAVPEVRIKMVEIQRNISKESSVVMDGRDIGTYVLPHADLKIFLSASLEERAKRRYNELLAKGISNVTFAEVLKDIEQRDRCDTNRSFAPLAKASDAIEIDTTNMSVDEAAEKIIYLVRNKD